MHHAATGDFQPATFQRAAHEGDIDLGGGFSEREKRRTKAYFQVVALKEIAQEVGDYTFQVGKADVLANP